ncbi:molybdopterin-binding protein [Thiovibrio sp. JS02]
MSKTVPVDEAVGMVLPHDITEIRKGEFKGRAFRKGHIIRPEDVDHLKRLGKEHIYVLELAEDDVHENEAADLMAGALAGPGTAVSGEPVEGKLNIIAAHDGLLKVDSEALYRFNLLGDVMCATLHDNTPVKQGELVAGTRLIPLVSKRQIVANAVDIAKKAGGILRVLKLRKARAGLIITGNEVFHGRIKDAFEPVLRKKLEQLGSEVIEVRFAPDNPETIANEIQACLAAGADLIVTSGGMSVDPDDVTRMGITLAGATEIAYGTPVLPGAMFLVGSLGGVPVLGLPACGMFHKITVFDLVLPRVLAGEKIGRQELAMMGHGGLCRQCKSCVYPICGFGK